uniref:Uncharacterized protein n=1 Tax=Chromera velia CCMP2878 TaxID=1169474 RepID=A0A0G4I9A7_9ALVE|eukprot:Cvel_2043.t1-p1 / transcript=Cvel_2043.t1 / gene=Cvel_2043 / organism=Chromera_velia_CCMP2878 / gene_product=hypothetical protein / transcript_product=hypothetical protein / location=Cvel_scaffold78:111438-114686(-) / protein_length=161 / sequence_SO=supercontig / SO=protein_coding / is_pseudo=false
MEHRELSEWKYFMEAYISMAAEVRNLQDVVKQAARTDHRQIAPIQQIFPNNSFPEKVPDMLSTKPSEDTYADWSSLFEENFGHMAKDQRVAEMSDVLARFDKYNKVAAEMAVSIEAFRRKQRPAPPPKTAVLPNVEEDIIVALFRLRNGRDLKSTEVPDTT